MPTSTSTGRVVKEILNDPAIKYKAGTTPKTGFCKVVDKRLKLAKKDMTDYLKNNDWQSVYTAFTKMRRLIEIKTESCK